MELDIALGQSSSGLLKLNGNKNIFCYQEYGSLEQLKKCSKINIYIISTAQEHLMLLNLIHFCVNNNHNCQIYFTDYYLSKSKNVIHDNVISIASLNLENLNNHKMRIISDDQKNMLSKLWEHFTNGAYIALQQAVLEENFSFFPYLQPSIDCWIEHRKKDKDDNLLDYWDKRIISAIKHAPEQYKQSYAYILGDIIGNNQTLDTPGDAFLADKLQRLLMP